MPKLIFYHKFNVKFKTSTINVMGAFLKVEGCEILQIDETKYGYQTAFVELTPEKLIAMRGIEEKVNEYLRDEGLPCITIVYGNRVYPRIKIEPPPKKKKH